MEENKKSFKMPIIILVAVLVLLLVGAVIYVTNSNKPKNIFMGAIDTVLGATETKTDEMKTASATLGLGININSQDATIAKVAEYLNKANFTINAQMDLEKETELVKLGVNYENSKVLDAKISYKNQDNNIYAKVEELFDKAFSIEVDEEMKETFKTLFEEAKALSTEDNQNSKKAVEIIEDAISNRLKDEYFSQENMELDVNGEKINTKKSVLSLTPVQFKEVLTGIISDLKNNEEFINCFVEEDRQEVKNALNELEESISEFALATDESTVTFNIYTKGISNKFVKFELVLKDQKTENVISLTKNDEESYEFLVTNKYLSSAIGNTEAQEVLSGLIMVKEVNENTKDYVIVLDIEEIGEITINVQLSYVLNEEIENMDISNSVNIEELTELDQQKIMTNLQNMKIYKIVQEIITAYSSNMYNNYEY